VPPSFEDLAAAPYVSLMTFRRNGVGVATPVWIAGTAGRLYVFTDGTSAKMKRLRVTDRILLAPCDMRGKLRGEYAEGRSRTIEDPALIKCALAALSRKYGWRFGLANFFSRRFGRIGRRAYLEISVHEPEVRSPPAVWGTPAASTGYAWLIWRVMRFE